MFLYRNDKLLADAIKNVSRNVPFSIRGELYVSSLPSRQHFKNNGVPIHCVAFSAERGRFSDNWSFCRHAFFVEIKVFDPKYCKAVLFLPLFSFLYQTPILGQGHKIVYPLCFHGLDTYFKLCPRMNKVLIYHLLIFCFKFGDFHCQHQQCTKKL